MIKSRDTYTTYTIAGLVALLCGVILYVYFVNISVVEVVMRKELLQERNELQTQIAMLESSYIQAQHSVAKRIAELDGYEQDSAKIFVSRTAASLAFNAE